MKNIEKIDNNKKSVLEVALSSVLLLTPISLQANNDIINAGAGNDIIYGDLGNDTLDGGPGLDSLFGGVGDDTLVFGATDYHDGGVGVDIIKITTTTDNFDFASYTAANMNNCEEIHLDPNITVIGFQTTLFSTITKIVGDASNNIALPTGWNQGASANGFTTYENAGTTGDISDDVNVFIVPMS